MDRKKIIGEVAARHGVRLDEDDPAMVMATIAEIAFRDAQAELVAAIRAETAEFVRASGEVQERAGAQFGAALRKAIEYSTKRKPKGLQMVVAPGALFAAGFLLGFYVGG